MEKKFTASVHKLFSLLTLLEKNGVNLETFLYEFGLAPDIRLYPDRRIPTETLMRINRKAADITGDKYIGLHQGEIFLGFSNILGHVLLNCENLGEALHKSARYQRIIDEGRTIEYSCTGDKVILEFKSMDHRFADDVHFIDHVMAGIFIYSGILTGRTLDINEAFFVHAEPESRAEYERIFRCKLNFNAPRNAFVFDASGLLVPVLQPNRELLAVFEKYAQEVLQRLSEHDSYANRVRRLIVEMIRAESPSIEAVASRLRMSERNLQLKLKQEGTTFSQLLLWVRRELATEYLKDKDVPVEEISYLLGYSDPSVFNRSFKKWTNVTPGSFRKSVLSA